MVAADARPVVMSVPDATMEPMGQIRTDAPFVGRAAELRRLGDVLAGARGGTAAAALISGDAGVGKTRLVGELSRSAGQAGVLVAFGHCVDIGAGGLPYLPFAEAIGSLNETAGPIVARVAEERPMLRRLTGAGPGAIGTEDGLERLPLFDAVATVLSTVSREQAPVLLVLEDLHWADASTRDLLRFLLARLGPERLLIVGTYRSDDLHRRHPLRPLVAELFRLPRVEHLELTPFDDVELRRFLESLGEEPLPDRVLEQIRSRSEGNAYYAEELLAARDDGERLPGALADVLLARLERLPEPGQLIARVAAVAGRRVPDGLLREACGLAADQAEAALREAVAHHVLVPVGADRYAFRHALLQEAVYADLLPGERTRLHATYARLLAAAGDRSAAGDLAYHSLACHDLVQALASSIEAADEADCRLAPGEALAHYEQALQLWDAVPEGSRPPGRDEIELLLQAAHSAASSGDLDRSVVLARDATALADRRGDPRTCAHARSRLAMHLYAVERLDDAAHQARIVRNLTDGQPPTAASVWAAALEARIAASHREGDIVDRVVAAALPQARALGLAGAEVDLMISRAFLEADRNGLDAVADYLKQAHHRATEADDPASMLRAGFQLAGIHVDTGDLPRAVITLREVLGDAVHAGLGWSLYALECRGTLINSLEMSGAWDEALAEVAQAASYLPQAQYPRVMVPALPIQVARDPVAGLAAADGFVPSAREYAGYAHQVFGARADALSWLGRPAEAVEAVRAGLAVQAEAGEPYHLGGIYLAAVALAALVDVAELRRLEGDEAAVAAARTDGARLLHQARGAATHGVLRYTAMGPEGQAWLARAIAEERRLRGASDAVQAWQTCVAAFAYAQPYELARSRLRLAESLVTAGDRSAAGREAVAARGAADRLGARPLRDAVDALARRARLDLGAGVAGHLVLTPREEEVLRLVAEGLTNRQIGRRLQISEKTARVHVSNILGKLEVSGRAEAVSVAHRRGLLRADSAPGASAAAGSGTATLPAPR
jgi:DNA-binding NarL/FixJ family response regulator